MANNERVVLESSHHVAREFLPRVLALTARMSVGSLRPTWQNEKGELEPSGLLDQFRKFWRRHGEPLINRHPYHEAAPQIVMMAFMQTVLNGGGRMEREYAAGSGRLDLLVEHKDTRMAMELKVWRPEEPDPLEEGLEQLDNYLVSLSLDTGWLVIFDRRPGLPKLALRTTP